MQVKIIQMQYRVTDNIGLNYIFQHIKKVKQRESELAGGIAG